MAQEVRDRVLAAAQELGYVLDVSARNLRKRSTRTLGLVVSELRDPFYAELAASVSRGARDEGYRLALFDCGGAPEQALSAVDDFVGSLVAGALVTPFDAQFSSTLVERGVPVVEIDRATGTEGVGVVLVNNFMGARRATEYLLEAGHTRIALIVDEVGWSTGYGRLDGYQAAIGAAGAPIEELVVGCGFSVDAASSAVGNLLDKRPDVTAIFAANNVIAEGVWRELQRRETSVPETMSLIAFDDAPWMTMFQPAVTCVQQPVTEMGRIAVQHLLALVEGTDQPRTIMLPTKLMSRTSVAHLTA